MFFFPFTEVYADPDYIPDSVSESSFSETYPKISASISKQDQSSPKPKPHSTQVQSASKSQEEFDENIPCQSSPKTKSPIGEEIKLFLCLNFGNITPIRAKYRVFSYKKIHWRMLLC